VTIFFKNRIIIDQLKHQEKVTPSLHKLCKYYNNNKTAKTIILVIIRKWWSL